MEGAGGGRAGEADTGEGEEGGATACSGTAWVGEDSRAEVSCKVFTLLSSFSLITIKLEPDILYSRQQNRSDVWEFWIVH